ncbi:MAG: hypothetical protein LBH22_05160 [Bacteroidales bacterium]|jgi:hypothetical protein|nr:hypothetical protein [Bacteroidales bacterium]
MKKETAKEESDLTFEELLAMAKENTKSIEKITQSIRELRESHKNISKDIGGMANSNGDFAEEYFANTFKHEPVFADMHFDSLQTNVNIKKDDESDEFDIVLHNDKNIAIIEIKYKARVADIEKVIAKADSFRKWFPHYKNRNIYLGLASLSFNDAIIRKAKEKGIAIIRQRGGKTIVSDKNLKAY